MKRNRRLVRQDEELVLASWGGRWHRLRHANLVIIVRLRSLKDATDAPVNTCCLRPGYSFTCDSPTVSWSLSLISSHKNTGVSSKGQLTPQQQEENHHNDE